MKHRSLFILCMLTLSVTLGSINVSAQVTYKDYLRADDVMSYSNYVYGAAVNANWLGESNYFWYKNHEKEGDFFYLVNAETGKKYKAADKKDLAKYLPKKQKDLTEMLLKDEPNSPYPRRRFDRLRMANGLHISRIITYISPLSIQMQRLQRWNMHCLWTVMKSYVMTKDS